MALWCPMLAYTYTHTIKRGEKRYRMDWMVFEKMISLYESLSESLYPPWWMSFICFNTVD